MSGISSCMCCGGALPLSAPNHQKNVACEYCNQANPNPNFVQTHENLRDRRDAEKPAKELTAGNNPKVKIPHQTIFLKESSFSTVVSGFTLLAAITLFFYFLFNPTTYWLYLASAISMLLPIIHAAFIPARWDFQAMMATVRSHEKYDIEYETSGLEMFLWLGSYIFMVWFIYKFFMGFIPAFDDIGGREGLCGMVAFLLGMFITWLNAKMLASIGEKLGKMFPKK